MLLVLPFDNRTGQPSLEWIREAAAEILSTRFASAGFQPTSRADRMYALDHLGLPQGFQPSRASSLKLAQTLDADSIVVGSYTTDGTGIVAEATLVDVPQLRMLPEVSARGEMKDLIAVFGDLAWKLTRQLDPRFNVAEETFAAAGNGLRLDAFEQYIRGITEPDQAERLRHLENAVKLSPEFGPAWMALGREDYNGQQYQEAAAAFAKVDRNGPDGLEAEFYRGLSLLFLGDYRTCRAGVCRGCAGVAAGRGGEQRRSGREPPGPGRNFAIHSGSGGRPQHSRLPLQSGGEPEAAREFGRGANELAQCLKLRPNDSEAQALDGAWKLPGAAASGTAGPDASADPLERIVRTFDAAAFRQAAAMLDEMNAGRLAALTPRERAQTLCAQAKGFLDRGLLLEAERLYQDAVAADGNERPGARRSGRGARAQRRRRCGAQGGSCGAGTGPLGRCVPGAGAAGSCGRLSARSRHGGRNALKLEPASRARRILLRQI